MAKAAKETFWNNERMKRNWSLDYIATQINVPKGTLGNWFAGISAPRDDSRIQALCNLFGIDFDTGYNAFYHAERNWRSSRNRFLTYGEENFWQQKGAESHKSLTQLAKDIGISVQTLSNAFRGKCMPTDANISTICKAFDVDFNVGKEEFKKNHEAYMERESIPVEVAEPATTTVEVAEASEVDFDFWPRQLRSNPFTIKDLSQYLNVDEKKVTDYFTGKGKPNFNQIRMLCNLYNGIDMLQGSRAFTALQDHYNNAGSVKLEEDKPATKISENASPDIFEIIYGSGKLSYKDFIEIYQLVADKKEEAVLRILYNQLDFDDYYNISKVLSDWCK